MTLPARPCRSDPALREKAIVQLANDCAAWDGDRPEDWLDPLRRSNLNGNGYELARDLERKAYVEPDEELVEILAGASHYLWSAHSDAVKAWVAENNVRPTLEVGTRVRCRYGEGIINSIREDEGVYIVLQDKDRDRKEFLSGGGTLVEYEDVTALAGEAATAAKTPKSGLVHEHATAKPERPNTTPILPKKERT